MPAPRSSSSSPGTPTLVPICFFASGFAGLALETVWSRLLALRIGGSAEGVTAVVTAYMAGLGLGSLAAGRFAPRSRNPLRLYAWLEVAIALFAVASPLVLAAPDGLFRLAHDQEEVARALPFAVRFLTSLVLLMVPTFAMGATLPLLVEALTRRGDAYETRVAVLYGINTVGAVAGTLAAGFWLLPAFGNQATLWVAAGLDLAVAALLLAGPGRAISVPAPDVTAAPSPPSAPAPAKGKPRKTPAAPALTLTVSGPMRRTVLVAFAISGALAMTYELGWTRRLAALLGSSVYSFALLLATFLAGLGLGALVAAWLMRMVRHPLRALAAALGLTGVAALAGTAALTAIPELLRNVLVRFNREPMAILGSELVIVALVLLPAALLLGAIFPLAARIVHRPGESGGGAIGRAYAVNTAGTVLGAAGAGLFVLPFLGTWQTLQCAAWIHVALGVTLALLAPGAVWARLGTAVICATLATGIQVLAPAPDPYRMNYGVVSLLRDIDRGAGRPPSLRELERRAIGPLRILSLTEGRTATVAVVSRWDQRQLVINGKVDASSGDPTEVLLGQLPMILADSTRRVLVIGYGSGITTHSVLTHQVQRVETVEIEPAVVEAGRFFADLNGRDALEPRAIVHIEDGRTHLAYTRATYDVIVSEPSNPWIAGINNLFTAEFYALVKQRLAPDGLFCQWLHGYDMSRETLASLLGTLGAAFPGAEVYKQNLDFLVIWRRSGAFPTRAKLDRAWADTTVRADLARVGFVAPVDLLALYLGPIEAVAPRDWRPNTDDNGWVEFRAPLDLLRRGGPEAWNTPPLASLPLERFDSSLSRTAVLRLMAGGVARRRELGRMRELESALEAAGATPVAALLRDEIARVQAAHLAAPRAQLLMSQSDAAFEAKDFVRCETLIAQARALEPDDPDILFRHGNVLMQLGRAPEAERALSEALAQRRAQLVWRIGAGEPYQAHLLLGIIASTGGDFEKALASFTSARDLNPYQTSAWMLLAATYEVLGRVDEARQAVTAGLAIDPSEPQLRELDQRLRAAK